MDRYNWTKLRIHTRQTYVRNGIKFKQFYYCICFSAKAGIPFTRSVSAKQREQINWNSDHLLLNLNWLQTIEHLIATPHYVPVCWMLENAARMSMINFGNILVYFIPVTKYYKICKSLTYVIKNTSTWIISHGMT